MLGREGCGVDFVCLLRWDADFFRGVITGRVLDTSMLRMRLDMWRLCREGHQAMSKVRYELLRPA